jgi:phenylacetate-CoA ligase
MTLADVLNKFVKSSTVIERVSLNIYERMPPSFRYKIFYGSSYQRWLAFLKKSEYWSKEKFIEYKFEQAKNLLIHSIKNVPYYRKLFYDIDFNPEKLQSLDDLKAIPLLNKETVRDRIQEFIDERFKPSKLFKKYTSGSTGIPMTIYMDSEQIGAFLAFRADLLSRIGYTARSKQVSLWEKIYIGKKRNLPFVKYGNKFIISIRYFTKEFLHDLVKEIQRFDPEYILGYPSALAVLSGFIKRHKLSIFRRLKAVISYTETLYDWQRELIEEAFGARVFSLYAMTEASALGGGCEYLDNLHFYPQHSLVELEDINEEYKEIVGTGFTNYAMPFIRYRTGDMVTGSKRYCDQCGRYYQVVNQIEGRINDFLINEEGNIIPRLMTWIKIFPNVKQFQFSQDEPGKAYLKIVRAEKYSDADTQFIRSKLEEMLGPMKDSLTIEIVFVDSINRQPTGKINLVDQRLDIKEFFKI